MKTWTERFVRQLMKDNGHLDSFLVDLMGFVESREVAAYVRSLGYGVIVHPFKNRLAISRARIAAE